MLLGGSGVSIGGVRILREGYKTSYPFLRPRIRVITPFATGRGPPCNAAFSKDK